MADGMNLVQQVKFNNTCSSTATNDGLELICNHTAFCMQLFLVHQYRACVVASSLLPSCIFTIGMFLLHQTELFPWGEKQKKMFYK